MAAAQSYPVWVEASLDSPLSRWLWLVKWVLIIPIACAWIIIPVRMATAAPVEGWPAGHDH